MDSDQSSSKSLVMSESETKSWCKFLSGSESASRVPSLRGGPTSRQSTVFSCHRWCELVPVNMLVI